MVLFHNLKPLLIFCQFYLTTFLYVTELQCPLSVPPQYAFLAKTHYNTPQSTGYYSVAVCRMYAGGYCLLGGQENMSSEPENEGCTEEKQGFCHVQFDLYGFGIRTQTGMMRRNKKSRAGIQYTRSCGSSSHPPANYKSVKYKHTQIVCIPLAKYLNSSSLCSTVAWVNRPLL